jgi:hypothetical protein
MPARYGIRLAATMGFGAELLACVQAVEELNLLDRRGGGDARRAATDDGSNDDDAVSQPDAREQSKTQLSMPTPHQMSTSTVQELQTSAEVVHPHAHLNDDDAAVGVQCNPASQTDGDAEPTVHQDVPAAVPSGSDLHTPESSLF